VKKGSKRTSVVSKTAVRSTIESKVNDIEVTPKRWLAATNSGLFISTNDGKSWTGGPVMGKQEFTAVQAHDGLIVAATRTNVLISADDGGTWKQGTLASYVTSIRNIAITPDSQIVVASREGAFRSSDKGDTWEHMVNGLPDKNISSVSYDAQSKRLLATSTATGVVFESKDAGRTWKRGPDSGYPLRQISVVQGRFMAATPFDGVIMQPESDSQSASAAVGSSE
jgi:photosystem II stability/assembly factor-like uncharacterized protein